MWSRIAVFFCALVMLVASLVYYPRWQHSGTEAAISWDVSGYYWYLPSLFIYHDIKHQSFKDSILNHYGPTGTDFQQAALLPNGNYVLKYSSGMAVMYLPFFAAGHIAAHLLGYPPDGFSPPYQFSIQFGGLLIALLGIWILRKVLLLYYSDRVVAFTLLLLVLGTNYLNVAGIDCGMSHSWLFTIYASLLWCSHLFHETGKRKYAIAIGLLCGLAVLTRPTDIVSIFIPLLWGLNSLSVSAIQQHMRYLRSRWGDILLAAMLVALVESVQLVYWKYVSGSWLVYSYGNQGFSWIHPHVFLYALNYKCGWLTYSPMMWLSLIGIIPFLIYGRNRVAVLLFILVNYYIVSAWNVWEYGGRAMVQAYAVMSIPFAACIDWVLHRQWSRWVGGLIAAIFLYFNCWMLIQYHTGGLYDGDSMTKEYFWAVLGRWHVPRYKRVLLDAPDLYEGEMHNKRLLYANNFDTCTGPHYLTRNDGKGKAILLGPGCTQLPSVNIPFTKHNVWIMAEATVHMPRREGNVWHMPKMMLRLRNQTDIVRDNICLLGRLMDEGETANIQLQLKIPDSNFDTLTFTIWNDLSPIPIIVDDVRIWEFTTR